MIESQLQIGLVVERRALESRWGGHAWSAVTVFPVPPDVAPWTSLGRGPASERFYAGVAIVHLYSTDTANYRDNLASGSPRLWVVMRPDGPAPPVEVLTVTADPAEGEGNTEAGSNVVDTVPMPAEIAGAIAEFIAAHHIERQHIKRRRDRAGGKPDGREPEA